MFAIKRGKLSHLTRGYLICFTGTVLWSSTGVFIRYLTETYQMQPMVLAFWRDLILVVALVMGFTILNRERLKIDRQNLRFLIFYGFVVSLLSSLWTFSVALNGAAVATVLVYSSSAYTVFLGWRLFNERLGAYKLVAVGLSLVGCILVSGAYKPDSWSGNFVGVVTGLLSGLAFAGYSLMGRSASQRGINPWTSLTYAFGLAVPFLFFFNLLYGWLPAGTTSTDFFSLEGRLDGWVILIILAIGPTIGGYGLYTVSLTYLPAGVANLIATLEPAMTAVLAYIWLGELLTPPQLLGGILIIAGVLLLRWSEGRDNP